MKDDVLSQALKSLPRDRPREGFTAAVLARLPDARPRRLLRPGRLALAAALLLGLALLAPLALRLRQPVPPPRQASLEEIRRQQEELARELAALKDLAAGDLPLVYLAGDEETDLVLDLGRLARRRPEGAVRPASLAPGRND